MNLTRFEFIFLIYYLFLYIYIYNFYFFYTIYFLTPKNDDKKPVMWSSGCLDGDKVRSNRLKIFYV